MTLHGQYILENLMDVHSNIKNFNKKCDCNNLNIRSKNKLVSHATRLQEIRNSFKGYFTVQIRLLNGYLLFAANLADFHHIARLVPDTVAGHITRIASKPLARESADLEDTEESSADNNDSLPPIKGLREGTPLRKGIKENSEIKERFHLDQGTKVDFDELVERVKKRLSLDIKQSYLDSIKNIDTTSDKNKDNSVKRYTDDKYDMFIKNVTARIKKLNKKNVNIQQKSPSEYNYKLEDIAMQRKPNTKNNKYHYNIKEMSSSADELNYKDRNVATDRKYNTKTEVKETFDTDNISTLSDEVPYKEHYVAKNPNRNAKHRINDRKMTPTAHKMTGEEQHKKQNMKYVKQKYNNEEMPPIPDERYKEDTFNKLSYKEDTFNKPKAKQKIKTVIDRYDYDDTEELRPNNKNIKPAENAKVKIIKSTTDSGGLYKKLDMTQKDSYEDYVTPAKETDIYASSETNQRYNDANNVHKRYKIEKKRQYSSSYNNNYATIKTNVLGSNHRDARLENPIKMAKNYEHAEKGVKSEEIKAKTENLWYDNNENVNEDTIILSDRTEKAKHGTTFPTRRTYKMATPNFVANLPVVVEKYNFNEPIPEADREREALKYIGNPPASINKKVRLI